MMMMEQHMHYDWNYHKCKVTEQPEEPLQERNRVTDTMMDHRVLCYQQRQGSAPDQQLGAQGS